MSRAKIAMFNMFDGEQYLKVSSDYLEAIWDNGGIGVPVPLRDDDGYIKEVIDLFDGFMFCGGGDIDPKYYGETNTKSKNICSIRDKCELAFFKELYDKSDKPILGICRGLQIMNVGAGGTLLQHIDDHSYIGARDEYMHCVEITRGGGLSRVVEKMKLQVNSFHHQAIKVLASGFEFDALSEDGIIEAIYAPAKRFCIGVQWHPENLYKIDGAAAKIFSSFVSAC